MRSKTWNSYPTSSHLGLMCGEQFGEVAGLTPGDSMHPDTLRAWYGAHHLSHLHLRRG